MPVVLVSLVMPGCDDSDEAPATGGGGFQPLASKLIRAADGGTVVVQPPHEIAGTSITIPAGALAADTVISINTATPSLHPSGVSLIVDIGPDGTLFASPAVVKVVYDPASLPPGAVASSLTLAELCVGGLAVPLANVTVDVGASSVSGETSNLSDFVVTTPVLADARVDQEVTVGDTVTLDGSASTGTRSNPPLAFRWELTERPAASSATLSNPKATAPSFTADLEGLYVARLTVDDGFSVDTDVVQVVALPADTGPVPDEPGPGTGDEDGQTCTVSTTVSPSEGIIRTAWSPIPILEQTATGVIIDGVGTGPVRIFGSNDGVTCELDNRPMWAFAVGDDLDVSLDSSYAAQNFGGFPVMSGFGDWSDKSQYCVKVENPTDHEVFVQLQAFTSQAQSGAGRFVRSFVTDEGVWVPARTVDDMMNVTDGLAVVCMDLDNAIDEAGNPTAVPNDANVSGFGMIVGAFPANRDELCRRCALCRICDDDPMTDAPDCPMDPGCPTDNTTAQQNQCQDQDRDCIAASRESTR